MNAQRLADQAFKARGESVLSGGLIRGQSGLSADLARGQSGWNPDQARGHRGLSDGSLFVSVWAVILTPFWIQFWFLFAIVFCFLVF